MLSRTDRVRCITLLDEPAAVLYVVLEYWCYPELRVNSYEDNPVLDGRGSPSVGRRIPGIMNGAPIDSFFGNSCKQNGY
jgi:hypothetical protein